MQEWRFYGREREVAKLGRALESERFRAVGYIGRRGIGKTELVREAVERRGATARTLFLELEPGCPAEGHMTQLLDEAEVQGLAPMLEDWTPSVHSGAQRDWPLAIDHLLRQDLTVVIDEFQNAAEMAAGVKRVIDRLGSAGRPGPGKLVMLGSDQQGMARMFGDSRQPLFQRAPLRRLAPWRVAETLEMANEQGFLRNPGRFLALWTAFGPVPRYWEEFHADGPSDLAAWPQDGQWREAFLDWAIETADTTWREHMHNWTRDELSGENFAVLRALSRNRRGGRHAGELRGELGMETGKIAERLDRLGLMGMTETVQPLWGPKPRESRVKWRVADNFVNFWTNALGPAVKSLRERGARRARIFAMDESLAVLEGNALEQLARGALSERWDMQGVADHLLDHGVVATGDGGRGEGAESPLELDMIGFAKARDGDPANFYLGSCKRSAGRHDIAEHLETPMRRVIEVAPDEVQEWLRGDRVGLLVSSEFADATRARLESSPAPENFTRIECIDIREMARGLGIDLAPEAAA